MKKLLAALFVILLMAGCGAPDLDDKETLDKIIAEAIDADELQARGGWLAYAPNKQPPYTGWAKRMYDNGQVRNLIQWKDGKRDGLWIFYNEDGTEGYRSTFKDGEPAED